MEMYTEEKLCIECKQEPIFTKKRGLGLRCYHRFYRRKKALMFKNDIETCIHDPRHKVAEYVEGSNCHLVALAEKAVFLKCQSLGFDVKPYCTREYDLNINGLIVDVKSASKAMKNKGYKSSYYRFRFSVKQKLNCDYLICFIHPTKQFFIIPPIQFKNKYGAIDIRKEKNNSHHFAYQDNNWWEEYENAWHLLGKIP